jgi:hypothetical protein
MRKALFLFFLFTSPLFAETLKWEHVIVADIQTQNTGASVTAPIFGMVVSSPIYRTYYILKSGSYTYVVTCNRPLNLTVRGNAWIANDKHNRPHVVDENGKDTKVVIVRKTLGN